MRLMLNFRRLVKILPLFLAAPGLMFIQGTSWALPGDQGKAATEAGGSETKSGGDLTNASLESLMGMDVVVTSSSKKAESLRDATTAIFVITQDDIRRSGFKHLADLMRIVPGVQVSSQSANEWAVSARGFNSQYNNKMLVLVDGRSVYDPILGGVYWNQLDYPLEDIDHIEVIRGSGGTLWGSNAVNGIVNIITKDSKVTQGLTLSEAAGSEVENLSFGRFGGKLAEDIYYRIYGQTEKHAPNQNPSGGNWNDGWYDFRAGFRADIHGDQDQFTFEGGAQKGYFDFTRLNDSNSPSVNPFTFEVRDEINTQVNQNAHLLGQWKKSFEDSSELQILAYYDYVNLTYLNDNRINNTGTADLEFQHRFGLNSWNEITWGGSYRNITDHFYNPTSWIYVPEDQDLNIYGGFLQDRLTLLDDRLYLTGGAKLENNPYTGTEFQPSGRLLWTPNTKDSIWGAVSRSVRIPTQTAETANIFLIGLPAGSLGPGNPPSNLYGGAIPNPGLKSEILVSYEMGYRTNPTKETSLDIAAFLNHYDQLIRFGYPLGPIATPAGGYFDNSIALYQQQNNGNGDIFGVELAAKFDPQPNLHLTAGFTYQDYDQNMIDSSNIELGAVPPHLMVVGNVTYEPVQGWEITTALYFTDKTFLYDPNTIVNPTEAVVRWDLGTSWKATDNLEISVWGQDLDGTDSETLRSYGISPVNVPPSFYGQLTLRY